MISFRDLPIRRKLMALIIVITTTALMLSGIGIVVADSILFHGYLKRDLATFSRVIADNTTASLAFDDPKSAGEILSALRARNHLVAACLFDADRLPFAQYVRQGSAYRCTAVGDGEEIRSTSEGLTVVRPVMLGGRRVGTLMIMYDLGEVSDRMVLYSLTVVTVLVVSSLLVVLLSSNLRTMFVSPILELAATTAQVSGTRDYSLRAAKLSNDEVGNLASTFNEMLAGIESRDMDLRASLAERERAFQRLAELNRELRRSNDELARSNQDLERFAFIASHDMQEPLRMVTVYSQLLARECGDAGANSELYRDYIVGGTRRMRELLVDLLAYVAITTGPRELEIVDVTSVVEKVKANLTTSIEETCAAITAGPLPVVQAQKAHIISLLQNLVGNSIKYRGAEPPRIHISAVEADGMYRFAVADNGMGIAPDYHDKIFMAFKRLHGTDIPGTGIGLAICQRIVERYGGRIWVESQVGKGATFLFTFPKPDTGARQA